MADRFYCPEPIVEGRATLTGDEARHLARVRRLGPGDRVELFDGLGRMYRASVAEIGRDRVTLRVEEATQAEPMAPLELTIASAVPKGERLDWLIEKATELGVARLIPLRTERSVVDPRAAKLDRLRRRVIEACKQCGRARLMALQAPTAWADLLAAPDLPTARFLALPDPDRPRWGFDLGADPEPVRRAIVAIGPEGGWTDAEAAEALRSGWRPIGLGPTILRVETAALAACALLFAALGAEDQAVH